MDSDSLKKNPFIIPEGYFDGMEASVRERIERKNRVSGWDRYMKPAVAMVCAFSLIFAFAYVTSLLTPSQSDYDEYSLFSEYSMMTYLFDNGDTTETEDISEEEIIDYLLAEDIETVYFAYNEDNY